MPRERHGDNVTFALCALKDSVEKTALDLKVPVDERKCLKT